MITERPTEEMLAQWKKTAEEYRGRLRPNQKSGAELIAWLRARYTLTAIEDSQAGTCVTDSILSNAPFAEKLPAGAWPRPRTFFLEDAGAGHVFFLPENRDPEALWGGPVSRIFVGVDEVTGYYTVEGSTMLWDALCAVRGLDEKDLQNYVCVAQYIAACRRFGGLPAEAGV